MHDKTEKRKKPVNDQTEQNPVNAANQELPDSEAKNGSGTPNDETISMTRAEFLQVKEHIDKLKGEREELVNVAKRTQADFDNFRKRNACVSSESFEDGLRCLTKDLLPVLDNFDRALQNSGEGDPWRDGIKLVYKQFLSILQKNGLEELEADGDFDPERHEAVLQGEEEGKEPGQILEVLQKGYQVKDRIIRHSMVKVAK